MVNEKLRTLIVLDTEKNYTKTAKLCNITQPAVTQHIQSLEQQYNIIIFKKVGKSLVTTPAGEILVKNAKRLLAINKNIEKEIFESLTAHKKLDIGITLSASDYLIPEILNVFRYKHPSLQYNFHTDLVSNLIERMKFFELDFAIIEGSSENHNFQTHLLTKDKLILITSIDHPFAKLHEVDWDMIKEEKLILRHKKSNTRVILDNYLTSKLDNINNYQVVLEIENTSIIRHLVRDGHGISFMSKSICKSDISQGKLKEIKIKDFLIERGVYLIYRKNQENDEIIKDIKKLKNFDYISNS